MIFNGVNFGGFLSQEKNITKNHLDNFITENDIKKVSDWGFNLIRLPIDYHLFESDENPYEYNMEIINRLEKIFTISENYNLYICLDFHNVPGFTFEPNLLKFNNIWDKNSENRKRFLKTWEYFSKQFKKHNNIMYEILNEPVADNTETWLELAEETINIIRKNDTEKIIVIESNIWASTQTFNDLRKLSDDKIIYSFHFYEPILVTHQFAKWVPFYEYYKKEVKYPGKPEEYSDEITKKIEIKNKYFANFLKDINQYWNKDILLKKIKPVIDFKNKYNVPILCGEFGCIVDAAPDIRANWLNDVISIFKENDISFAYWNYKNKNFGIYDFTDEYKDNNNYDIKSRVDKRTLEILISGIK